MAWGTLRPRWLLRCEGLAIFAVSLILYLRTAAGPLPFATLILVPDLSILGYLFGRPAGTLAYNLAHTFTYPLLIAGASLWTPWPWLLPAALVWVMHIALDRLLGYGLKYPEAAFEHTHLSRV